MYNIFIVTEEQDYKKVLSSIIMVVILMLVGCFGSGVADYNYIKILVYL